MGDPVDDVCTPGNEDSAHGIDKVVVVPGLVRDVWVDLGLDVEQDGLVGCTLDKVEHLIQGGDLCTSVHLWIVSAVWTGFTHPAAGSHPV